MDVAKCCHLIVINGAFHLVEPALQKGSGEVLMRNVGDTVNISCVADGLPEPRIVWRRNSNVVLVEGAQRWEITHQRLEPGFRTQVPTNTLVVSTLYIRGVLESDNNTQLSCSAINQVGEPATLSPPYTVIVVTTGGLVLQ